MKLLGLPSLLLIGNALVVMQTAPDPFVSLITSIVSPLVRFVVKVFFGGPNAL